MWCPNCQQNVAGQKPEAGNMGCWVLAVGGIGLAALFLNVILGVLILAVAGLMVIAGLIGEAMDRQLPPSCPICKAYNLQEQA
jgi:hypothetical protein